VRHPHDGVPGEVGDEEADRRRVEHRRQLPGEDVDGIDGGCGLDGVEEDAQVETLVRALAHVSPSAALPAGVAPE
jgi:hypothetical protein